MNELTYWAKSINFIAGKSSKNVLGIKTLGHNSKNDIKFQMEIQHIIHLSEDLFLILTGHTATIVDGNTLDKIEIVLKNFNYMKICSGTSLKENHFFLHTKHGINGDGTSEGRVYDFHGTCKSIKKLPKSLK